MLDAVGERAEGENFCFRHRFISRGAIRHHARKLRNLGDPAAVVFAIDGKRELHSGTLADRKAGDFANEATKTRTGSRTRATNPARPPVTALVEDFNRGKVTVARTHVDVPMLVLRGEMAESHRLPDRREGIPLHRQARRHPAHAHGPQAAAEAARDEGEIVKRASVG
jgi:hypothetical protein